MGFTDVISVLIFALIVIAVLVYLTMSHWVVGPLAQLKRAERIILSVMLLGVVAVMGYAVSELLFHVVF
jgi:hypothetical protein